MSFVVYLALIAAAVVALRRGPGQALLAVWLPVLLLLPDSFRAIPPGLPDPTFGQAAMVPLLAVTLMRYGRGWQPRAVDLMVIAYGARLQRWLQWAGHWKPYFTRPLSLPWRKASVITLVLAVGMVMTVARGPWLGAIVAAAIVGVGRARDRRRALALACAVLAVGAVLGAVAMADYLDIKPGAVMSMSQESAMYRKVLFEQYFAIALDHAGLGWGLTTWPKVHGMTSIDNYWLLLALMHGLVAMGLLVSMMALSVWQCLRHGMAEPAGSASLGFTLAGIFIAIFVSLGTVYLGEQALPTLFFLLGWAQALQVRGTSPRPASGASALHGGAAAARPGRFRAVIC